MTLKEHLLTELFSELLHRLAYHMTLYLLIIFLEVKDDIVILGFDVYDIIFFGMDDIVFIISLEGDHMTSYSIWLFVLNRQTRPTQVSILNIQISKECQHWQETHTASSHQEVYHTTELQAKAKYCDKIKVTHQETHYHRYEEIDGLVDDRPVLISLAIND